MATRSAALVLALAASCSSGAETAAPAAGRAAGDAATVRLAPRETLAPDRPTPLPGRFRAGMPFVEVEVDGAGAATFLLDTGFDATVLDQGFAERLTSAKLRFVDGGELLASSGDAVELRQGRRLGSLRAGPVEWRDVDAPVLDLSATSVALGVELAGILGMTLFAELVLTLDAPADRIEVGAPALGADAADTLALVPGEARPTVELDLGGATVRLLLDSGSNEYLAVPQESAAALPWAFGPRPFARATTAAGEAARQEYGRLGCDLVLGGHAIERPIAAVSLTEGRVGARILREFRATIDARSRRVRFERASAEPLRSKPWRGHGAGWREVDGRTVVLDVVPGSPAELAGLRVGDEVVEHAAPPQDGDADCGERHQLEVGFDGELACVRRDGAVLHFRLESVDLIP